MRAVVISILTFRTLFLLPLPLLLIVERGSLIIFYRYLVLNCECLSWIYCEALLRRIDIFRVIAYEKKRSTPSKGYNGKRYTVYFRLMLTVTTFQGTNVVHPGFKHSP